MTSEKISFMFFQLLLVGYNFASAEYCPVKLSEESNDYDVVGRFNKIKEKHKTLSVTHTHKRDVKEETYEYNIHFCGPVVNGVYPIGVSQKSVNKDGEKKGDQIVVGILNRNSTLIGGENWIVLQYFNGAKYNHHCHHQERKAWLYIRCEDQGEKSQLKVIEENRYDHHQETDFRHCFYLFEYNTPLACNINKKLSGGSIFIIVIISLLAAYLLFGFLYQRFVVKAKGFDQIPNYPFWRKFGNMSADGCDFVCRREETSNTYKGMADALEINSSDDDDGKDDGLLPM